VESDLELLKAGLGPFAEREFKNLTAPHRRGKETVRKRTLLNEGKATIRMANMRTKKKAHPLPEREIDKIVVAQADEDTAWEKPVRVRRPKTASVPLPSALATRVAFFARLHREKNMAAWLERIIQERLDFEEAAFAGLKRELATRYSSSQQEL
jgi:hypothetical protein